MMKAAKVTSATLAIALMIPVGCDDPQKEINKIFQKQGLNLLEPARSYISIGGIFVVPKKGLSHYLDPYNTLSPSSSMPTDFDSIVEAQTNGKEIGIDAVVSGIASMMPLPVGFSFDHTKKVKLDQIDTTGSRYRSQDIDALILMADTRAKLVSLLSANDGSKVYVVQEVYMAKSMAISTSDNTSLAASFGGGGDQAKCSNIDIPDSAKPPSSDKAAAAATSSEGSKSAPGPKSSPNSGNTNTIIDAAASVAKSVGGGQSSTSQSKPTNSNATMKEGASVSVCLASAGSLSFKSDKPLPFAVRLNQVRLSAGGTPEIMVTGVSIPNHALPAGEKETSAFAVDSNDPIIPDFDHPAHEVPEK